MVHGENLQVAKLQAHNPLVATDVSGTFNEITGALFSPHIPDYRNLITSHTLLRQGS